MDRLCRESRWWPYLRLRCGTIRGQVFLASMVVLAGAATFGTIPTNAATCEEDTLETVSDGGDILIMLSGAVYQVQSGGEVDSQSWLPTEDVIICGSDTIINKDENGERVDVTRLR
jgi:hypothetical protein